jgi:PEP-CTERM motif
LLHITVIRLIQQANKLLESLAMSCVPAVYRQHGANCFSGRTNVSKVFNSILGVVAFLAASGVTTVANADTIFSDYNSSESFPGGREVTGTSEFGGGNNPAYSFVAGTSGAVSQINLGLSIGAGDVQASLWTAATGCETGIYSSECGVTVPTTELGSWTVNPGSSTTLSITGITGVTLTAGTEYFMMLSAGTPTTSAEWFDNVEGANGTLWQCGGSNSNYTQCVGYANIGSATAGAFQVLSASPVPLPGSPWLILSGLGAIGAFARSKRAA